MTKKEEQEVIDVFKSGEFTIAYHDNGYACLYKGKYKYDDLPDEHDFEFHDYNSEGYLSDLVRLLAMALGGGATTI